jgi:uncharacterized protein involved in exopolysaccharide biosynthesis
MKNIKNIESSFNNTSTTVDEIDISILFRLLWDSKFKILTVMFITTTLFFMYSLSLPNVYKSEALLSPLQSTDDMNGLASQFGGLASLAGVDLSSASGRTNLGLELLKSRTFFKELANETDLKVNLSATKGWNKHDGNIIFDPDKYDSESKTWLNQKEYVLFGKNETLEPSLLEVYDIYKDSLFVEQITDSGFIVISFQHLSPKFAKDIILSIVSQINNRIRADDIAQANLAINYLSEQLIETKNTSLREGLYALIQKQTETKMLAKVTPEYVFKIIDPPVEPEEKIGPKRLLWSLFGAFIGFCCCVSLILVRNIQKLKD